jgi:uroporphyrinogen decarboxylase
VTAETEALLAKMAPYPNFVLSTGCDLPAETPIANLEAMIAAGRAWRA